MNDSTRIRRRQIMERLTDASAAGIGTPTMRELAEATGVAVVTIDHDLKRLERLGYIERGPSHHVGAIRVLLPFVTGQLVTQRREAA